MSSQKITTSEITSPVLVSTTNFPNMILSQTENGHSVLLASNSLKTGGGTGLKQKSFSFLMSKQLLKQPLLPASGHNSSTLLTHHSMTSRASSLSSSLSTSVIDQSSSTKSFLLSRQNSTANLISRSNFIKTKSS